VDGIDGQSVDLRQDAAVTVMVNQTSHGFVVGDVVRLSGANTYTKAQADSAVNTEAVGIVAQVLGVNSFLLCTNGRVTGLPALTANTVYFLSPSSAGALTATEPSTAGQVSKPLLVTDSTTSGFFFNYRGEVIATASSTRTIGLVPLSAAVPDGSTNNLGPALTRRQGSQSTQKLHIYTLDFDGGGGLESCYWSFRLPSDYLSGGTLTLLWMANSTSGNVKWQAQVGSVAAGDADTPLEHAFAAAATVTDAANATEARRLVSSVITLTMDGAAAGELISVLLFRDSADAADTCTADAELIAATLGYATT